MVKVTHGVLIVAIGATGFLAGRLLPSQGNALAAQPEKKTQPEKKDLKPAAGQPTDAQMEAMMKMSQPGENHKVLEPLIGTFEGEVKMWMAPNTDPMLNKGSIHREWTMGNRFILEHVDGNDTGQGPYKGMNILGYNTIENRYESAWIDNMSTYISTSNGTYDPTKKILTFTGDIIDPTTMKRTRTRTTVDISNPNREVMNTYCNDANGKEYKCFEGIFERTRSTGADTK